MLTKHITSIWVDFKYSDSGEERKKATLVQINKISITALEL